MRMKNNILEDKFQQIISGEATLPTSFSPFKWGISNYAARWSSIASTEKCTYIDWTAAVVTTYCSAQAGLTKRKIFVQVTAVTNSKKLAFHCCGFVSRSGLMWGSKDLLKHLVALGLPVFIHLWWVFGLMWVKSSLKGYDHHPPSPPPPHTHTQKNTHPVRSVCLINVRTLEHPINVEEFDIWTGSRPCKYMWCLLITLMCLSIGTPKNNEFSICSKWKIHYFQVSQNLGRVKPHYNVLEYWDT